MISIQGPYYQMLSPELAGETLFFYESMQIEFCREKTTKLPHPNPGYFFGR